MSTFLSIDMDKKLEDMGSKVSVSFKWSFNRNIYTFHCQDLLN